MCSTACFSIFFFNDTATTEIYTLSLHDALPISIEGEKTIDVVALGTQGCEEALMLARVMSLLREERVEDRKSTRLNSSHSQISYAVFCLKKKTQVRSRDAASRSDNDCLMTDDSQ